MRYKPSEWGAVALLMRDSTYKVLDAIAKTPRSWSELVRATGLTEAGLFKVLEEMKRKGLIAEVEGKSPTGAKNKKYCLSKKAAELRIYQTARLLKKKLETL